MRAIPPHSFTWYAVCVFYVVFHRSHIVMWKTINGKPKSNFIDRKFYRILRARSNQPTSWNGWLIKQIITVIFIYQITWSDIKKSYFSTIYVNFNIYSNHNDNWKWFLFPGRSVALARSPSASLSPLITLSVSSPLFNMPPLFYCFLFSFLLECNKLIIMLIIIIITIIMIITSISSSFSSLCFLRKHL